MNSQHNSLFESVRHNDFQYIHKIVPHHSQIPEHFKTTKRNPVSIKQPLTIPLSHPQQTQIYSNRDTNLSLWVCIFWTFHINGLTQYVAFCVWFPSVSIMFLRFIHVVAYISTSFLFMAEYPHFVYPFISWQIFGLFPLFWLL